MKYKFLCVLITALFSTQMTAQQTTPWRNKKAAVVITYDDAISQHLDNAIPLLDSLGLKATFYITGSSPTCSNRVNDWRKAAANGHELGNHTLYHPCIGNIYGREWVSKEYDMSTYTIRRITDEINMNSAFLAAVDGKTRRTFAFTCGDMKVQDSLFINGMKNQFVAARAVRNEMHRIDETDLYNVDCYMVSNHTSKQMIEWVNKAIETNSLLVILFHGVGGGNGLDVSIQAHRELLLYLKQQEKDIWVAPLIDVADHIRYYQNNQRISLQTETDYKDMLAKLKIVSLRPGANGSDPKAPNAVNYDETKANPYPVLPDPLTLKNGKKVKDVKTWLNKRRPEISDAFDREVLGRTPANTPKVNWEVVSETDTTCGIYPVKLKRITGHLDNSAYPSIKVDIQLTLATPANTTTAAPVIMEYGFVFPPGFRLPPPPVNNNPQPLSWQEQCLAKGWGYAIYIPTSVQADNGAGLTEGVIGLVNKGQRRKPDDWGTLKAWAWGASRILDYLETDKSVDAKRVAIEGHSRFGKAALVTLAYDHRFVTAFISSSGEGGASLYRRHYGEIIENVAASREYHWMAGNFIKYAGPLSWNDLPVDAHELIALCAPNPVFISSGDKGDYWCDPKGMFMAAVAAGPVYKLMGKKDLGTTEFPPVETGLLNGDIAFRQHKEGHITGPNWPYFLEFVSGYFK